MLELKTSIKVWSFQFGIYFRQKCDILSKIPKKKFLLIFFSAHPNFLAKPKDQRVGMNGIATFECHASGNPPPSVFWTKEGSQELMFTGTTHGQMHVTPEGTLTIQVDNIALTVNTG